MKTRALTIAFGIWSAGALLAGPFTNGNFESPVVSVTPDFSTMPTGWTVVQASNQVSALFLQLNTTFGIPLVVANGPQSFGFGGNGGIDGSLSQTFDTIAGASYSVGYQHLAQQGLEFEGLQVAALNGASVLNSDQFTFNNTNWASNVFTFTAASASTTLRFSDATGALLPGVGGSTNWALDAVTVSQTSGTATPEPSTLGLAGLAAGTMALLRKRK